MGRGRKRVTDWDGGERGKRVTERGGGEGGKRVTEGCWGGSQRGVGGEGV